MGDFFPWESSYAIPNTEVSRSIATIEYQKLALPMVASCFRKRQEGEKKEVAQERRIRIVEAQARGYADYEEESEDNKKRLLGRVILANGAIIAIIFYIITEDKRLPIVLLDFWTIFQVIIFIIQPVCAIIAIRKKKLKNEDIEEEMDAARQLCGSGNTGSGTTGR